MFQFPPFAHAFRVWCGRTAPGCPIRISADQCVFATNHGFSQLITSFFASESQGILHMPLFAFFYLFVRPALAGLARFCLFASNTSMIFPVENNGFEPLTPCLQSRCSSQLS